MDGEQTWGLVSVASHRTISLVDHYSRYDGDRGIEDRFELTEHAFDDNPDDVLPVTRNPQGTGIDLCDPAVMSPDFQSQCATAKHRATGAATVTASVTCGSTTKPGTVNVSVKGASVGNADCPEGGSVGAARVLTGADALVTTTPAGVFVKSIACVDADTNQSIVTAQAGQVKIPAARLTNGAKVSCTVVTG